jgi:YD repeat-containing protein
MGRKINMTDPDMGYWVYTYDANGNLHTQTDAKGQIITFSYDELNRVAQKAYSTSDPTVT